MTRDGWSSCLIGKTNEKHRIYTGHGGDLVDRHYYADAVEDGGRKDGKHARLMVVTDTPRDTTASLVPGV